MSRLTGAERDRILDMLGRREGYPAPIPYSVVVTKTGAPRSTLRGMVHRDRRRLEADPAHPAHGMGRTLPDGTGETASTPAAMVCNDPRLDGRQAVAVEALAVGSSVVDAAELAGVNPSTVHRWRQEPGFLAALDDAREDYSDQIRSRLRYLVVRGLAELGDKIPTMKVMELIRTVEMALDRTGFAKGQCVEHSSGVAVNPYADVSTEELQSRLRRAQGRKEQADRLVNLTDEELDAEIAELEAAAPVA